MKNKIGQLKIQQMAFVLIALTLFFVLVGLFVFVISFSGLRESAEILNEENALILASRLANSPEFACEKSFDAKINCIDDYKVSALVQESDKYSDFWSVSGIKIRRIYPGSSETEIKPSSEGTGVSNFVSICNMALDHDYEIPLPYEKCTLGKIIVYYDS